MDAKTAQWRASELLHYKDHDQELASMFVQFKGHLLLDRIETAQCLSRDHQIPHDNLKQLIAIWMHRPPKPKGRQPDSFN